MIFAPPLHRVVEHVDRRVLGAIQFVDAITRLPVIVPAQKNAVQVRSAAIVGGAAVPFLTESMRLGHTRSGFVAVLRAPFFDRYAETFVNPAVPPEVTGTFLRLRVAVADAGPHYLPQEFDFDLPRLSPNAMFAPLQVRLFRAPGAAALGGWAVLRVRVEAANGDALGGVLVRVFRHPGLAGAAPIGEGMTEWRGDLRGEALVAVADLPRFRPGENDEVVARTQEIQFEAVRDTSFPGNANQLPDGPKMIAGSGDTIVTQSSGPPLPAALGVVPAPPLAIRAGQETTVALTMA